MMRRVHLVVDVPDAGLDDRRLAGQLLDLDSLAARWNGPPPGIRS